jgi:hypothetical protein
MQDNKAVKNATHSIGDLSFSCKGSNQVSRMIANSILRSRIPQVDDVGIIAKGKYTTIREIFAKKISRPVRARSVMAPCRLYASSQAMHKDDTVEC